MSGVYALTSRALMMLALIVWIGGIIFFAFVLAPTLFSVLPTPQMAGNVVAPALAKLHLIGLVSGAVFLICSLLYDRLRYARFRLFTVANILVVLMLALTAISQFFITPAMQRSRTQMTVTNHVLTADEIRQIQAGMQERFQRLHTWSTRSEGAVLFMGLAVVFLTARRFGETSR